MSADKKNPAPSKKSKAQQVEKIIVKWTTEKQLTANHDEQALRAYPTQHRALSAPPC